MGRVLATHSPAKGLLGFATLLGPCFSAALCLKARFGISHPLRQDRKLRGGRRFACLQGHTFAFSEIGVLRGTSGLEDLEFFGGVFWREFGDETPCWDSAKKSTVAADQKCGEGAISCGCPRWGGYTLSN